MIGQSETTVALISGKDDKTMEYFADYLRQREVPHCHVRWEVDSADVLVDLCKSVEGGRIAGVYVREPKLIDVEMEARMEFIAVNLECSNAILPSPRNSNWSKPFHAMRLSATCEDTGSVLGVPPTLATTSVRLCPSVPQHVLKPCSNLPGLTILHREGLSVYPYETGDSVRIPFCSQLFVKGYDIRVHVIDDECFATRVYSETPDCDYKAGESISTSHFPLDEEVREGILALARAEDGRLTGVDIRVEGSHPFWVLEVNPMPGYHTFEAGLKDGSTPISDAILYALLNPNRSLMNA